MGSFWRHFVEEEQKGNVPQFEAINRINAPIGDHFHMQERHTGSFAAQSQFWRALKWKIRNNCCLENNRHCWSKSPTRVDSHVLCTTLQSSVTGWWCMGVGGSGAPLDRLRHRQKVAPKLQSRETIMLPQRKGRAPALIISRNNVIPIMSCQGQGWGFQGQGGPGWGGVLHNDDTDMTP